MDLENEKIGPAYKAPDSYFKESETRIMQRLGIVALEVQMPLNEITPEPTQINPVAAPNTIGVQKRARKQDPITSKSLGIDKEMGDLGSVVIPPLTFTTNENPEWVNFGAISEEGSILNAPLDQQIKKVSFGDLLNPMDLESVHVTPEVSVVKPIENEPLIVESLDILVNDKPAIAVTRHNLDMPILVESAELDDLAPKYPVHNEKLSEMVSVPTPVELPLSNPNQVTPNINTLVIESQSSGVRESADLLVAIEDKPIAMDAPATAFAPIAGRQAESATPGWLGVAAALAAIVAAYFIWTAIQPPVINKEEVVLQQEEATIPDAPLDDIAQTDTIPDGRQLVEPLIIDAMPNYIEPNVYSITDAAEMPVKTKRALQDLEDHGLATFDMEDELFEELDLESL